MGKADLQIHTRLGDGLDDLETILEHVETRTDLDVVAITDHDDVRSAFALRDLATRRGARVRVVTGSEVTTRVGHLLALYVEDQVPILRPLAETVRLIHAQGGLAVVPHPLSYLTFSVGERALRGLAASGGRVDGIEVLNPTFAGRVRAARARVLNAAVLGAAETGGSDAHQAALIGTVWTEFPGTTPEQLRQAIRERATAAAGREWTVREHLDGVARQQWQSMVVNPTRWVRRHFIRR